MKKKILTCVLIIIGIIACIYGYLLIKTWLIQGGVRA